MKNIRLALEEAEGKDTLVTLAYAGGSRPGQTRQVFILSTAADRFEIVEPPRHIRKTYLLEKVLWLKIQDGDVITNGCAAIPKEKAPNLPTLPDYADYFRQNHLKPSWWIDGTELSILAGDRYKNGNPKQKPKVSLHWVDPTDCEAYDPDTGTIIRTKRELSGRERPWRVYSVRLGTTKCFSLRETAIDTFYEELIYAVQ